MSVDKAKNNYIGSNGARMNCAQSVLDAFKEKYNICDDAVEAFKSYGGGRAPEGLCGAYYAAKYILEKESDGNLKDFEDYFSQCAGALKCREIKGGNKLSCLGCVEKSSEFLDKQA